MCWHHVQPYFLSLRTDKQNVPTYWLKNIPHYSATKKEFTSPPTKQSTIKTYDHISPSTTLKQGFLREAYLEITNFNFKHAKIIPPCDKWVPVTTAWRVLRLRMEERPPIWRVAANKLNKQSRTANEGWSSSLGVGRDANNTSPWKTMLSNTHMARCFLWRQNNPEVNYSPTRISGGECF